MTDTMADPRRWKALAVLGVAYLMVVLDISIVNVALPSIQSRSRLLDRGSPVGRLRLRAHLRRLPAARRAHGRPARAARRSSWSGLGLFLVTSLLRGALDVVRDAHRRAAPAGCRGRDPLAVRLLDHARHVRGGRGAEQGARHPRRHRRARAPPSACSSAASSPSTSAGSGSSSSTSRSPRSRSPSSRATCARAGPTGLARHFDAIGAVTVTASLMLLVFGLTQANRVGWALGADDPRLRGLGDPDGVLPLEREPLALAARPARHLPQARRSPART